MTRIRLPILIIALFAFDADAAKPPDPSRAAVKGCTWERLSDPALGLAAWVQRCDYGFRKIDFLVQGNAVMARYSDGGDPYPQVEVLDLQAGESPEAGIRRVYAARTEAAIAKRCVLAPWREGAPSGRKRYAFVPDAAYRKELDRTASPDEVPEPACGDLGDAPDGIQYFEAQPDSGARKVLFVRVGQDEPLFDEATLELLPAK